MTLLYIFDLMGTFAFAISGAMLGVKKGLDIYGQSVLALAVAVGGGTMREILLGGIPPFVLRDPNYLYATLAAVVLVAFFTHYIERSIDYINVADAIGLGTFTLIGATKAIYAGLAWYGVVFCAVLTCTGGGMIRDILAGEIPIVLKKEIYASASMVGAFAFLLMNKIGASAPIEALVTSTIVISIRLITLKKNIHLRG